MKNLEGLRGAKVISQESTESSQFDKDLAHAFVFLEQYNNQGFAELLKGLTNEVRISLFNDLAGSFSDILGETYDIDKAKEALMEYNNNMLTDADRGSSINTTEQKYENRRLALKKLKASVIS